MSNLQLLAVLMLLVFLPMVISRECYQCLSKLSFEDCDDKRINVRCLSSSHQCVKAKAFKDQVRIKLESYVKGCVETCSASHLPACNDPDIRCEVKCCSSDYCNGASVPVVSGLLLIVTASFMYLFGF